MMNCKFYSNGKCGCSDYKEDCTGNCPAFQERTGLEIIEVRLQCKHEINGVCECSATLEPCTNKDNCPAYQSI